LVTSRSDSGTTEACSSVGGGLLDDERLRPVMDLPGRLVWRYSFDVAATEGGAPYFAVFEGDFADATAMAAAPASPQGRRVAADVANYATGGAVIIHYPVQDRG
jgi:hypothetical protein